MADDLPVEPPARKLFSTSVTFSPRSASRNAVLVPMIPPPMTTTSAVDFISAFLSPSPFVRGHRAPEIVRDFPLRPRPALGCDRDDVPGRHLPPVLLRPDVKLVP